MFSSVQLACGISRSLQDHPIYPNYQTGFSHLLPMPHDLLTLQSALSHTNGELVGAAAARECLSIYARLQESPAFSRNVRRKVTVAAHVDP